MFNNNNFLIDSRFIINYYILIGIMFIIIFILIESMFINNYIFKGNMVINYYILIGIMFIIIFI